MKLFIVNSIISVLFYSCSNLQGRKIDPEMETNDTMIEIPLKKENKKDSIIVADYMIYVVNPTNGLIATKEIGNFNFSLLFKPIPFVAISNLDPTVLKTENLNKESDELKDLQYFTLKIQVKDYDQEVLKYNLKSMEEYEERVNYFSFKMQKDLQLIEGKDTLDCALFHFERNYGIAPVLSFVMGFPKTKDENFIYDKKLSFNERVFGTGRINMVINKEDLIKIPEVKIN